ncbi:unnamed protein product [Prorocentrum cordatum]|nr:unnamed protein product [Polarella glacialis]
MIPSPTQKNSRLPIRLCAKKVLRNTNGRIYAKYSAFREQLRRKRGACTPVRVATHELAARMQCFRARAHGGRETSRELETDVNEAYLWHGTKYEAVEHIFSEDFHMGKKTFGFFGAGLYFADSCAKADEYSTPHEHMAGWYKTTTHNLEVGQSVCVMLLCRVILGEVDRESKAGDYRALVGSPTSHKYDSLFGERDGHRREVILYHESAVFPEFCVLYTREYQHDSSVSFEASLARTRSLILGEQALREPPPAAPPGSEHAAAAPVEAPLARVPGEESARRLAPAAGQGRPPPLEPPCAPQGGCLPPCCPRG